mgnify:CR=1 FL=1
MPETAPALRAVPCRSACSSSSPASRLGLALEPSGVAEHGGAALLDAREAMNTSFGLTHVTIQIEDQDLRKAERELKY